MDEFPVRALKDLEKILQGFKNLGTPWNIVLSLFLPVLCFIYLAATNISFNL